MSKQYPGGLITKTPVTPSGSYETSTASGIWTLDQQAYWAKLGQWPTAGNPGPDAQFNYVTMLLHGDGTNGAQNNTFLDSSSNTFTITRNGNTTQGSFSPYGDNWSNYFAGTVGSPDYFTIPSTTNLNLTGDYTVECWYKQNATTNPTGYGLIFGTTSGSVGTNEVSFLIDYPGNGFNWGSLNSGVIPVAGVWYHLAATKSGTTTRIFVNGVLSASSTTADTPPSGVNWYIGSRPTGSSGGVYSISGYVSNCRIVKGTALYTSSFTPSTTPLTAVSGTQFLTCQSNRFIDNSTNNYTITVTGTPSVQRFNPFGASTAYSTSVIGGSAYIDNNGYLDCGSQSAYAFGTGDFTINTWIYPTSIPTFVIIMDTRGSGGSAGWALAMDTARTIYLYSAVGFTVVVTSASGAIPLNAWSYITVTRSGTSYTLYINGVSAGTGSGSQNFTHQLLTVGYSGASGGEYYYGYISNAQVIKGTAVAPTLPTAPVATSSGTSVLLNMQNAAIFDNAMMNDLVTVGNAQISTSVKKYGTGSMYFDGTGDALVGQNTPNISLSGNFTIEAWVYQTDAGQNAPQLSIGDASTSNGILLFINTSQQLGYFINSAGSASGTAPINTWHHIAVVRSGSNITTYLNGVTQNIVTYSATFSGVPYFGATVYSGVTYYGAGYIDDLRITKGYARYTANFTPPTSAFSNIGPT